MTSVYFSMGYSSIDIKLSASKFNVNYQNKLWHQLLHYVSQQIRSIQSKVYRGTFRSILQHFLVLYLSLNSKTFDHSGYKPMSCIPKYGNMMVFIVFHSQWWHNSPTNFRFLWVPPHRHTWARKAGGNGYVFAHTIHTHTCRLCGLLTASSNSIFQLTCRALLQGSLKARRYIMAYANILEFWR